VADARLAVIGTLTKGYDLDYIWKQIDPTLAANPAGYYRSACCDRPVSLTWPYPVALT
jgi:hypothetical protein